MISRRYNNQKGFIALISAIIISLTLLALGASLSLSGFYLRGNILSTEFKEKSAALSEACVETAILEIAKDGNYSGNETVFVGNDSCYIRSVSGGSEKTIETQAEYRSAYTNLRVVINPNDFSVISWEEIPTY